MSDYQVMEYSEDDIYNDHSQVPFNIEQLFRELVNFSIKWNIICSKQEIYILGQEFKFSLEELIDKNFTGTLYDSGGKILVQCYVNLI